MPIDLKKALGATALATAILAGSGSAMAADLRVNIAADPSMIDPITYSELIAGQVISNMYESFTAIDADGQVIPALAESWEPLEGNLGFRFKLREGVKFHSGREFTAEDVKFSFEELLRPGNKAGLNAPYLDVVVGADAMKDGSADTLSGVTVVDDYTVEVAFTRPDVLFPIYPIYLFDSGIVEEAGPEWYNKVSAGTGAFKFENWSRGQKVELAAHADYWGGAPAIDGVEFVVIPSPETAMAMFETSDLDVMVVDGPSMRRVLGNPELKERAITAARAQVRYLAMNSDLYEPFKDKRVREAVCRSLDQDAMIAGLYSGAAKPLYGQVTEGVAGYNPDLPKIEYDPEKAKALLAEAGYPNGEGLPPVKLSTTEPNKNQHLYFASQLQEVLNMPVDVELVERGTHLKSINSGQTPFFAWGWSAGYPDGLYFLSQLWYSDSPYNRGWKNAEFDALIDKASMTADNKERYAIYQEAEGMLMDDWGTCPLPVSTLMATVRDGVSGVAIQPFGLVPFADVTIAE